LVIVFAPVVRAAMGRRSAASPSVVPAAVPS